MSSSPSTRGRVLPRHRARLSVHLYIVLFPMFRSVMFCSFPMFGDVLMRARAEHVLF